MSAVGNPYADPGVINLASDTQTRPTAGMRRAIAEAQVGDEQHAADPTVRALEERVARLLGHEAGVFLPSGTMCNQIGIRLHVEPSGDEVLLDRTAHPLHAEAAGAAVLSGALLTAIAGTAGVFGADDLEAAIRPPGKPNAPRTRLVCVEQTANLAGGRIWPLATMRDVVATARRHDLRTHLDGARLLNAVVATGVDAASYASMFDTAWLDLSKGLGAPVGAVLVGSRALVQRAWRYKHMLGGALRQSGILAAAGVYALDHHVQRLADDHDNARVLAAGLVAIEGVQLDLLAVETNMVFFDVQDAPAFVVALARAGVLMEAMSPRVVRAVTHLDIRRQDVEAAVDAVARVMTEA
jgi:threonine aldolase